MPQLILFNKPYGVLCQFTGEGSTLADYISDAGFYAAGRLDKNSEGLVILTNDGKFQARISHPQHKMEKSYWAQVEGEISAEAIRQLEEGVSLKDGMTQPTVAVVIESPLPERNPPIRFRASIPTSWLSLTISQGKNRQVRRMTAAVGFPTLRLFRYSIGPWNLEGIALGDYRKVTAQP